MKTLLKLGVVAAAALAFVACSSEPKSVEYYQNNPDKRLAKLAECEAKLKPIAEQLMQKSLQLGEKLLKGEISEAQVATQIEADAIKAVGGEKAYRECQNAEAASK